MSWALSNMLRRYVGASWVWMGCVSCVGSATGYDETERLVWKRSGLRVHARQEDARQEDARQEDARQDGPSHERAGELLEKPLTLETAAQVALLINPTVEGDFAQVGIARADLAKALELPNPRVHAHVLLEDTPTFDLGADINLMSLLAMPSRERAASKAIEAASYESAGRIIDVAWSAKAALVRFQSASQAVQLEREYLRSAFAMRDAADKVHEAGNFTDLELLEQRAIYEQARLDLAEAELTERMSRQALGDALGLPVSRVPEVVPLHPPRMPTVPQDFSTVAVERSLDRRAALARYAALANQADVATLRAVLPALEVGVAAELHDKHWSVGPAVGIEVPLFSQGQGERERVDAAQTQVQAQHRALMGKIVSDAKSAQVALALGGDRYAFFRDQLVPLRRQALAAAELQYNAMNLSVFRLVGIKQDLLRAQLGQIRALESYWMAVLDFDRIMSGRLPSGPTRFEAMRETPDAAAH